MTDAELIRQVAEKVMDFSPLGSDPMPVAYQDGHGPTYSIEPSEFLDQFNPLTNANHRDMVVERMREKGYTLSLGYGDTIQGILTWVRFTKEPHTCYSHHKNPGHAVAMAALAALKAEGEKP